MNAFDECRGWRTKQTTQPLAQSMTCSTHSTLGSLVAPRAGIRQAQYAPSLQAELALSIEPPQRRLAQPRTAATLPPQHSTFVTAPSDDPQPNEAGCCAHRGRPGWVATLRQRAARLGGAVEAVAGAARLAACVGQAGVPDGACATSTPAFCAPPFASADGSRVVTHWRQRDWQSLLSKAMALPAGSAASTKLGIRRWSSASAGRFPLPLALLKVPRTSVPSGLNGSRCVPDTHQSVGLWGARGGR